MRFIARPGQTQSWSPLLSPSLSHSLSLCRRAKAKSSAVSATNWRRDNDNDNDDDYDDNNIDVEEPETTRSWQPAAFRRNAPYFLSERAAK